jgi:hypothetical protein
MGPPEPDDTGPTPAQRPRSVVTTSRSSPMVGITPTTCPGRTCGGSLVSTCSFRAPPALWRRVSSLGRQAASSTPEPVRIPGGCVNGGPALPSTLVRATHCQRWTSLPRQARFGRRRASRSPTTAIRRTWCARRGLPRRTDVFRIQRSADSLDAEAADTGRLSVRTPGSHRSRGHRSPGHRTSARPVGWTDVRTADSGRGQSDERRGRRPDTLDGHDDGDRRPDGATLARVDDRKIIWGSH